MPRKKESLFTEGELNKLIDSFLHPIARQDPYFWVADTLLHAMIEQDPGVTVDKFVRYTVPKILEQAAKRQKKRQKKRQRKTRYDY